MSLGKQIRYFLSSLNTHLLFLNMHIGKGTSIGKGTIVRDNVVIGKNCYIGNLCVFEGETIVGDNTCIESQCHITRFSRIGSHVFIAPFFLSTNDSRLTYHRKGHEEYLSSPNARSKFRGVIIGDDVRIAGHVMTLPGVRIGKGAIVGSFSLVTKNVAPYTLVYGVPAKEHKDTHNLLKEEIVPFFK